MKKLFYASALLLTAGAFVVSCGKDPSQTDEIKHNTSPLSAISDISLDSNPSSQVVKLSRNVESDEAVVSIEDNSSWIRHLKLSGNEISFDVEENPNVTTGHRYDNIIITIDDVKVGSFLVTQARNRKAPNTLQWANSDATYYNQELPSNLTTGKAITEFIYNLEKTTNGKDSYKNYPAFAYCIEMNHDPEHNMEWHMGMESETEDMRMYGQFGDDYYWCADDLSETYARVYKYNSGATSRKKTEYKLVYAFRNGKMDLN